MRRLVDYEDVKLCVDLAIKHGITLRDFRESVDYWDDFVDLVRCRDCKYWHSNTEFCDVWSCMNVAHRTLNMDYCSRGERREDGEV